jgi:hypothetical protein
VNGALLITLIRREQAVHDEMLRVWHTEKRDITHPDFLRRYTRALRRADRLKLARLRLIDPTFTIYTLSPRPIYL